MCAKMPKPVTPAIRVMKTVVLEMAIVRLLHESGMTLGNRKIIYVSPIKVKRTLVSNFLLYGKQFQQYELSLS